tara:strand:- start:6678 stop:7736 length:1059 start_codon:yes stop_codon:yes gene_type:complete
MRLAIMLQHEREYFVSRLRSGTYYIDYEGIKLKVLPPTVEDQFFINAAYKEAYDDAFSQDVMTNEDMMFWMYQKGLWGDEDEQKLKDLDKNIEKLKVQMFENRYKQNVREAARVYLRATEKAILKETARKDSMYENTCEGVAFTKKCLEQIKRCTFLGAEPCDFSNIDGTRLWSTLTKSYLSEKEVRLLARSEPFRSIWLMKSETGQKVFSNCPDRELTFDQRNISIWSRMYDNVQESQECPADDVIQDDDLLDGWFIIQRKKQEKERLVSEVDNMTSNDKIANSQEIFVFTDNKQEAENINNANSFHAQRLKQVRMKQIKEAGVIDDHNLQDKRLEIQRMSNEQYKSKFRR